MKFYSFYSALVMVCGIAQFSLAQGCSDPGICTIGSLNPETTKDTVTCIDYTQAELEELLGATFTREKFRFELSGIMAQGEKKTQLYGAAFTGVFRIKKKMLINIKVPYTYVYGSLGTNSGLGDITLSLQNTFYSGKYKRFSATVGVVIPTGNANKKDNDFALPMTYQTTLGAYNVLVGVSAAYKKWGCVLGYQHSFGKNENEFNSDSLTVNENSLFYDELNGERKRFTSSQNLKRGSDVILRLERRFDIGKKFGFNVGVLPIYRLSRSTITLDNGEEVKIDDTDGLTFNVTGGIRYSPSRNWLVRFNFGAPVITRKVRADGLAREYVGVLSVAYKIW